MPVRFAEEIQKMLRETMTMQHCRFSLKMEKEKKEEEQNKKQPRNPYIALRGTYDIDCNLREVYDGPARC